MAPETRRSSATEMSEAQAEQLIMERKTAAAKRATTVGAMSTEFKREVDDVLQNPTPLQKKTQNPYGDIYAKGYGEGVTASEGVAPEALKRVAQKHSKEMESATHGKEGIKLMKADPTRLGQNRVGGGDASMELNTSIFEQLDGTGKGAERIEHTFHHESAHGKQTDAPLTWLEGHAEISANESTGKGMDDHREGQPASVYGEGQDTVARATRIIGREQVEEGMTKNFNVIIRELMVSKDPEAQKLLTDIAASP